MHIIKSKAELTITRIKRLLEILSSYSFNSYYIKGKDMILSNFLSRQKSHEPHEIILSPFNMQNILQSRYYNIGERQEGKYLVQTSLQVLYSSITLPEVNGVYKGIDPNRRSEGQVIKPIISSEAKSVSQIKPRLVKDRASIK